VFGECGDSGLSRSALAGAVSATNATSAGARARRTIRWSESLSFELGATKAGAFYACGGVSRSYTRRPLHRVTAKRRRSSPGLRLAVRAGAAAALAAAVAVPLVRRRFRIPAPVTTAAVAAGPLALAVLRPRTPARDVALFTLQMWAFTVAHELPYDKPEALRRRLRVRYPIHSDRVLGGGELPTTRLQRSLAQPSDPTVLDRALSVAHWAWFFQPHLSLLYVLARDPDRFPRAARQLAATYDLGCVIYFLVPTAPPWWAAEQGHVDEVLGRPEGSEPPLRRIMVDVGKRFWGRAWPRLYDSLGGNPWAAMPSLHFATSLMSALLLAETGPGAGVAGWAYAGALGFALVYLGEHYVTDLIAGTALVVAVRSGEPVAEPVVERVNQVLRRLERLANS
jgi:membrane-associated phospholipid phosphatase